MDIGRAMFIAAQVHQDQFDLAGAAYIFHPIRVSQNSILTNDSQRKLALLHDTLEDYDRDLLPNLPNVLEKGLTPWEFSNLQTLTRTDKVSWDTYITLISEKPTTSIIKIADLEDNMNIQRLQKTNVKVLARLGKYHEAWIFLKKTLKGGSDLLEK